MARLWLGEGPRCVDRTGGEDLQVCDKGECRGDWELTSEESLEGGF